VRTGRTNERKRILSEHLHWVKKEEPNIPLGRNTTGIAYINSNEGWGKRKTSARNHRILKSKEDGGPRNPARGGGGKRIRVGPLLGCERQELLKQGTHYLGAECLRSKRRTLLDARGGGKLREMRARMIEKKNHRNKEKNLASEDSNGLQREIRI